MVNGKHTAVLVLSRICLIVCVTLFAPLPHSRCAASEAVSSGHPESPAGHGRVSGSKLSVAEIFERVQKRYGAADFEADFVQESHLQAMGIIDTAKGHVYFRRPAMMRWHYKTPEEYFIITDGQTLWIYSPEDNQVMLGRAADHLGQATGPEFFSNPKILLEDFVVELAPQDFQEKGRQVLRLVPKTERSSLVKLFVFISKSTFDIVQYITYNALGDKTSMRFSELKFNQGLDLSLFAFKIPKGADVVQLDTKQGGY